MGTMKLCLLLLFFLACHAAIPVIIDTDIGQDMDDSWAIAEAVQSPELDVKLILTAAHNAKGRAQITAKYLTAFDRTDIPIGVGLVQDDYVGPMYGWAQDYDVSTYAGTFYTDGISAALDIIGNSTTPITIIAIAPVGNIQQILALKPDYATKINIVAMSGSIYRCYGNAPGHCPEYNVDENVGASVAVYNATWATDMVTTPLDTSGIAFVKGADYQNLLTGNTSSNLLVQTLLETYVYWSNNGGSGSPSTSSTTLYDPVAVYLAYSNRSFVGMEVNNLVVDAKGDTLINAAGRPVNSAVNWTTNGEEDWAQLLVSRLLSFKN